MRSPNENEYLAWRIISLERQVRWLNVAVILLGISTVIGAVT